MKNSKKILEIILVIIFCLICLCALVLVVTKITTNTKPKNAERIDIDDVNDGLLNFDGIGVFFDQYTGDLKTSEIAKQIEKITLSLPTLLDSVKNYNEMQLSKYFYENEKNIKETYGITDCDKFIEFIEKNVRMSENLKKWYRVDINRDSFKNETDKKGYAYVEYSVLLKNDQKIDFSLYVAKSSKKSLKFIVDVIGK